MSAIKETMITTRPADNEDISRDDSRSPSSVYSDHLLDVMADTDEKCVVEDAQVLIAKDVHLAPPALPVRNSLRTSRLLDSLRLNSIKSATESISTPHDTYLSSEEDASSSADDFSGDEFDLEEEENSLLETPGSGTSSAVSDKPSGRKSHEDTARLVSVVFVGRPSIVELSPRSKTFLPPPSFRRPSAPLLERPSTETQLQIKKSSNPARHSSILRKKPAFLNTDPYSRSASYSEPSPLEHSLDSPLTPMTPTGVMSRFQKGLSLVRKRSRANLKTSGDSRDGSSFAYMRNGSTMTLGHLPSPQEESSTDSDSASLVVPKVSHTRSKTNTTPITPISPATPKRGILQGFSKKRRQSLKI